MCLFSFMGSGLKQPYSMLDLKLAQHYFCLKLNNNLSIRVEWRQVLRSINMSISIIIIIIIIIIKNN